MALLVDLPFQLSFAILREWISLRDLSAFDMAMTCHTNLKSSKRENQKRTVSRQDYLQILQDPYFVIDEYIAFQSDEQAYLYIKWLAKRGIKTYSLSVPVLYLSDILKAPPITHSSTEFLDLSKLKEVSFTFNSAGKRTYLTKKSQELQKFLAGDILRSGPSAHGLIGNGGSIADTTGSLLQGLISILFGPPTNSLSQHNHDNSISSDFNRDLLDFSKRLSPKNLAFLTFHQWNSLSSPQLQILLSNPHLPLQRLILRKCSHLDDTTVSIVIQQYRRSLQSLDIACCEGLQGSFFSLLDSLEEELALTSINISYCRGLGAQHLMLMANYSKWDEVIAEDCVNLREEIVLRLIERNHSGLKRLNLDYSSQLPLNVLNAVVANCNRLEEFVSSHCIYRHQSSIRRKSGESKAVVDAEIASELTLKGCYTRQNAINQLLASFPTNNHPLFSQPLDRSASGESQAPPMVPYNSRGLHAINAAECRKFGNPSLLILADQFADSLLSLKLSPWKDLSEFSFLYFLQRCRHLQSLNLSFCDSLTDAMLQAMGRYLPQLRELNLKNCVLISDAGLIPLVSSSSLSDRLHTLEVENCLKITNKSVAAIFSSLFVLKRLNLVATSITSECYMTMIYSNYSPETSLLAFETADGDGAALRSASASRIPANSFIHKVRWEAMKDNLSSYWDQNPYRAEYCVLLSDYLRDEVFWTIYSQHSNIAQREILKKTKYLHTIMISETA
jgi:hypothetical protein